MKRLKVILLIISLVGLAIYTLPALGSDTADVDMSATLATGPPVVTTVSITNISTVSFTANGNITSVGGSAATRRGFCYITGTSGDPTIADSVAYEDGAFGVGAYSIGISGLTVNTQYRVRAYAVNSEGTSYGVTLQTVTKVPDNMIIITGTGTMTITGPNPFTTNITSINVSINAAVDNMTIEVNK